MAPSFNPDTDIPDLSGKVVVVTGGNVGLGRETVLQLSKHNPAHIYLAGRSEQKCREAIDSITSTLGDKAAPITHLPLDLTSFASIKAAADKFNAASSRLHLLYNNAGIMATPAGTTQEGYEIQFGTNHMGHALLTKLLLPALKRTAAEQKADVRIVTVSSDAHSWAPKGGVPPESYKTEMTEISSFRRYGQSKLANIHYSRALAARNPDLKCVAIHPGVVRTTLIRGPAASFPMMSKLFGWTMGLFTQSVEQGTLNQLWAGVSPDVQSGEYYVPVGKPFQGSADAQDTAKAEALWEWTEKELAAQGY